MILVIFGVCIGLIFLGILLSANCEVGSDGEFLGGLIAAIFAVGSIIAIFITIFLTISVVNASTIDERLAMYQEENAKIKEQIDILVKDYQEYESGVFSNVKSESAITLVSMYPELKADQLVSSQLDIYVENNEQIKNLKLKKINADVVRWWLYFGGN